MSGIFNYGYSSVGGNSANMFQVTRVSRHVHGNNRLVRSEIAFLSCSVHVHGHRIHIYKTNGSTHNHNRVARGGPRNRR